MNHTTTPAREVITIATGAGLYRELAIGLARSFYHWNRAGNCLFTIVTDSHAPLPDDLRQRVRVVQIDPPGADSGYDVKLCAQQLSVARHVVLVDADALFLRPVDEMFDRLAAHPLVVYGEVMTSGSWYCDVAAVCAQFQVPGLTRLYGDFYYFHRPGVAEAVFSRAQQLAPDYDTLGLRRLRGRRNEEILVSLAMALNRVDPLPLGDSPIANLDRDGYLAHLNVLTGSLCLIPHRPDTRPAHEPRPVILHFFHSGQRLDLTYRRELIRLHLYYHRRLPLAVVNLVSGLFFWPRRLSQRARSLVRRIRNQGRSG